MHGQLVLICTRTPSSQRYLISVAEAAHTWTKKQWQMGPVELIHNRNNFSEII